MSVADLFTRTPGEGSESAVDSTYDALEQMPSFWKRGEIDVQHPETLSAIPPIHKFTSH